MENFGPDDIPDLALDGRCALLTGAGRGIGLGIARTLAAAGCAVAIQDIDRDVAAAEAERINAAGGTAVALGGDVTDLSLAGRLVAEAADRLGGLHVLVNNASIQVGRGWLDQGAAEMEAQLRADLLSPILLCQQAAPLLRPHGKGRILNIGSIQARTGNPFMLAYSASKKALEAVTTALARDLAPDRVTVNLIAPGYFDTFRNRDNFKDEADKQRQGRRAVPLGRLGLPRDVAGLALLLCGDAGAYVTGQIIFVDGGMCVR